MSSTARIPKAEIDGAYGWMLKRFSRKLLDDVLEPAEVMWHNRAVLSSFTGAPRLCGRSGRAGSQNCDWARPET
jgi:hypothetical protein